MDFLSEEYERLPLWSVVFLSIGIIFGTELPFSSWITIIDVSVYTIIFALLAIYIHKYISLYIASLVLGIVSIQSNGFNKDLCITKKFIDHKIKTGLVGKIKSIEQSGRKNIMQVTLYDVCVKKYSFIKKLKMVCSAKVLNDATINDKVYVYGELIPFNTSIISGTFDEKRYNYILGIDAKCLGFYLKVLDRNTSKNLQTIRNTINGIIESKASSNTSAITKSLLTGDKKSIPKRIRSNFINAGVAHILAISGLHMSIIVMIIFTFIRIALLYISNISIFSRINHNLYAAIVTILSSYFYLCIADFPQSAIRAFIMSSVVLVAKAFGRNAISINNIIFAGFITLVVHPASLFSISFQLSYLSVIGIISTYEIISKKIYMSSRLYTFVVYSVITSLATSIFTFPISVSTFNQHSIISIASNIIVIPLVSLFVMPLLILSIATFWFTNIFVILYEVSVNILLAITERMSGFYLSNIAMKSMHTTSFTIFILGSAIFALCITKIRLSGVLLWAASIAIYSCEKNPDIIIYGKSDLVVFARNGALYTNSTRKKSIQTDNIRRYLGISVSPRKIRMITNPINDTLYIYLDKKRKSIEGVYAVQKRRLEHPLSTSRLAKIPCNIYSEEINKIIKEYF